jgi:hypothetical protein
VSTFRETPEPRLGWITGGYQYETWRDQETRHERLSPLGAGPDTRTVPPIEGLRTALSQAVAGLPEKPGVQQTLSPEDRARLEALGYVAR